MVKLENLCSIPSEVFFFFFLMENIVHIDLNQLLTDYLIKVIHTDLWRTNILPFQENLHSDILQILLNS